MMNLGAHECMWVMVCGGEPVSDRGGVHVSDGEGGEPVSDGGECM